MAAITPDRCAFGAAVTIYKLADIIIFENLTYILTGVLSAPSLIIFSYSLNDFIPLGIPFQSDPCSSIMCVRI